MENGAPRVCIVLKENADSNEQLAAQELAFHFKEMTGSEIPVGSIPIREAIPIFIGPPRLSEVLPHHVKAGGFVLTVDNQKVAIEGADSTGTLMGTYELLEQLGVRWLRPGASGTIIPKNSSPTLRAQTTVQSPSFASRNLQGGLGMDRELWKIWLRRNRAGGPIFPNCHGMKLPKGLIPETSPELFALVDGNRRKNQVCVSNPALQDLVEKIVRDYFKQHPDEPWIGLGPGDGRGYCQCGGCNSLDANDLDPITGQISKTDRYIWFFNLILDRISDEFPDKKIAFYAYSNYMRVPIREKPSPRIVPALAPINLCRIHGPGNPICSEQTDYVKLLREWKILVPEVYDRGYWSNLADPGLMFPSLDKIQRQVSINKQEEIEGFRIECFHHWASEGPSLYLALRLMWNASADPEAILKDYYGQLYGPAGEEIAAFYSTFDQALSNADFHAGGSWDFPQIYTSQVLQKASEHMACAKARARNVPWSHRVQETENAFLSTCYFLRMLNLRTEHDFSGSFDALGQMKQTQERLMEMEPPLINPRHAPAYLNRYFSHPTTEGYRKTTTEGQLLLKLSDSWQVKPFVDGESADSVQNLPNDLWHPIRASHTWSVQGLRYYKGSIWYKQNFPTPVSGPGKVRVWLAGVDEEVEGWINGHLLSFSQAPPFWPIEAEISKDWLKPVGENFILLKLTNLRLDEIGVGGLTGPSLIYSPVPR